MLVRAAATSAQLLLPGSAALLPAVGASLARGFAAAASTGPAKALVIGRLGAPEEVLELQHQELPPLGDKDVLLRVLAAPINPSDINTIEGKYPLRPQLPGVAGHEGVAVVEAVGAKVSRMRTGDHVVPIEHAQGTWRSHGVFSEDRWYRIPRDLPISTAATMVVNPPTAVRLLEEYVQLNEGDTIVQTGATSAVGKLVIELAKSRGINTVNLIRDRPNRDEVVADLKELGATLVITPDELKDALASSGLPPPKLALDCVSGEAATAAAKALEPGGTLVVYGAMSMQPLTIPAPLLIFKDLRVRGFWLTGGYAKMEKGGLKAKEDLVDRVCALFRQKVIRPLGVECIPLDNWHEALERNKSEYRDRKVLLINTEYK